MTDTTNPLGRRSLIRSGAIGGTAALLAVGTGTAHAAAVAPPPVDSTTFPDFSLIKINSDDDSLKPRWGSRAPRYRP